MRRNELTVHPHTLVPDIPMLTPIRAETFSLALLGYAQAAEPASPQHHEPPRSALFTRPPPAV